MPQARLQSTLAELAIDADNGIIRGVIVMEDGKVACFKCADGTKKTVLLDSRHVQALLRQAGNRAIPVHKTHSHVEGKADGLETKVGKLSNFKVGDDGHLRADLFLAPGEFRDYAIWHAKEDPENMMLSAVFNYAEGDADCIPCSFEAADLVEKGAGVTALLADAAEVDAASAQPINYTMLSPEDLEAIGALIDQKIVAAMATETAVEESPADKTSEEEDTAPMEEEAGVTDEDKKDEDKDKPAFLAALARISRAHKRQLNAALSKFEGAKAEIGIAAEAKLTATLGTLSIPATTPEGAKTAKLAAFGCLNGSLPRAMFTALSPYKQSEFCRLGGKISDN